MAFIISCDNKNSSHQHDQDKIDSLEMWADRNESLLLITQEMYHKYTDYLRETDERKKLYKGKQLVLSMIEIDSLLQQGIYDTYWKTDGDSLGNIGYRYLSDINYGIAWWVHYDSLLNELNKKYH